MGVQTGDMGDTFASVYSARGCCIGRCGFPIMRGFMATEGISVSDESTQPPLRRQALLLMVALVAAAAMLPYVQVLGVPLHGAESELLRPGGPLDSLATAPEAFSEWPGAPLAALSFGLTSDIFPGAAAHRFAHLLLHAAATVLVLLCALRLGAAPPWALAAAGIFAAVPALVPDLIHYLPSRPVVLGAAFALLSFYALLRAQAGCIRWLMLCGTAYLAAAGAFAPLALFALLALPLLAQGGEGGRRTARMLLILMAGVCVALAAARYTIDAPLFAAGVYDGLHTIWSVLIYVSGASAVLGLAALSRLTSLPVQAAYAVAIAAAVGLAGAGWWQSQPWKNPATLWERRAADAEHAPEAALHMTRFILTYADASQTETLARAATLLEASLPAQAAPADAWRLLADARLGLGDADAAYAAAAMAVRRDPFSEDARARLAVLETVRTVEGEAAQERARRIVRACAPAQEAGVLPGEAVLAYAQALADLGDTPAAARLLAGLKNPPLEMQQQINAAARLTQQSAERAQQAGASGAATPERFQYEAETALLQKNYNKAFYWLERLLSVPAPPARAYGLMAVSLAGMASPESFNQQWGAALTDAEAWRTAAEATVAFGFWDAAEDYLRHAQASGVGGSAPVAMARIAVAMRQPDRARAYIETARAEGAPETEIVLIEQQLGIGAPMGGAISLP